MPNTLHFPLSTDIHALEEKQFLGSVGSLSVSVAQEAGKPAAPLILVVVGGVDDITPLQSFAPTPEGAQLAVLAGRVAIKVLAVAQATWAG
ncbi:hypothetical protein [Microvirga tunisiensis]|uniref:Uncharacterized protein n=1 Tax=Microvirga tunisiensis TaxID=2108360 RepID=A0A5N7MQ51_9HYPH|nr:hypothetical protein [Microvirga tunisiensis]MPR10697.1 hypothetical protein [Microvirga tunisiensis]MPR28770.1 hypothetical protein [Microvirga tunisiensis]